MEQLQRFLTPITVVIDDLLFDANNLRFSELGEEINATSEPRFAETKVQDTAYNKMRDPLFDVRELRDTIKTIGFLPMDRMVVRQWRGDTEGEPLRYVVIEGNRRLAAIRWLLDLHESGKETLDESQLTNLAKLECLLLDDRVAPEAAALILPGLRHVSGIKEWGPYQKARAVYVLRETGMSPQEVAQSLGLSTRAANSAYRCYQALERMKSDEEYGEFAEPKLYSYFEELLRKRNLKDWLAWDEEEGAFTNVANLYEFYSWIVPGPEKEEPKLSTALSVRDLSIIIEDEEALAIFRGKDGSLPQALAKYQIDHPSDWYPKLTAALSAVQSLTPDALRHLSDPQLDSLRSLRNKIEQALRDRDKLMQPD